MEKEKRKERNGVKERLKFKRERKCVCVCVCVCVCEDVCKGEIKRRVEKGERLKNLLKKVKDSWDHKQRNINKWGKK
jgi:hypothetical protein